MNHETNDREELLSAHLDGELTAEEAARVDVWLAEDAAARSRYEELRAVRSSIEALPKHSLEADFSNQVLEAAEREVLRRDETAKSEEHMVSLPAHESEGKSRFLRPLIWSGMIVAAAILVMQFTPKEQGNELSMKPAEQGPAKSTEREELTEKNAAPGSSPSPDNSPTRKSELESKFKSDSVSSYAADPPVRSFIRAASPTSQAPRAVVVVQINAAEGNDSRRAIQRWIASQTAKPPLEKQSPTTIAKRPQDPATVAKSGRSAPKAAASPAPNPQASTAVNQSLSKKAIPSLQRAPDRAPLVYEFEGTHAEALDAIESLRQHASVFKIISVTPELQKPHALGASLQVDTPGKSSKKSGVAASDRVRMMIRFERIRTPSAAASEAEK